MMRIINRQQMFKVNFLTIVFVYFVSLNAVSQYSLVKVDSIVISKKYKSFDVKELSKEIAVDFKSDSNKIRAYYMYVVCNIKYDISLSKRRWYPESEEDMDRITLEEVNKCIRNKKGICWDYSALFQKLCFYEGIEVEQIGGTLRLNEIMPETRVSNHDWNSLMVNGKRKFIDCTFVPPDNYVKMEYDKFYLVDPEEFIYRCQPDDPTKQYIKTPITYAQFKCLPYVENAFYEHKIKTLTPNLLYLKVKSPPPNSISFQIANIEKLTSIEVYRNEHLVQTIPVINLKVNFNLDLKLVPGDKIKIEAIRTISRNSNSAEETVSPIATFIVQ